MGYGIPWRFCIDGAVVWGHRRYHTVVVWYDMGVESGALKE